MPGWVKRLMVHGAMFTPNQPSVPFGLAQSEIHDLLPFGYQQSRLYVRTAQFIAREQTQRRVAGERAIP